MCRESVFGDVIHAFGAYLHFHPLLFGTEHGDVEAFVAVAFGHREPVAHAFWIALIHVGDDAEHLPALGFLSLGGRLEDDADGEEVIDAIDADVLLLHLLPDGVDALGASLHVIVQACGLELLVEGAEEPFYVGVAAALCLVEFLFYVVVGVVLEVLQAQVFQLALEFVETEFVCQRSVEVCGFHGGLLLCFLVLGILYLAHDADAVGYHDEDDAHVFCKSDEQAAEVLALYGGAFGIDVLDAHESVQDACHFLAEVATDFVEACRFAFHD